MELKDFIELTKIGELYVIKKIVNGRLGVKRVRGRKDGSYYTEGPVKFLFYGTKVPDKVVPKIGYYVHYLPKTKTCAATTAVIKLSDTERGVDNIDILKE